MLNQTYSEIEIIVVDDGSTDESARIATDYANRHSNLRLVQQENQGLAKARNAGIRAATGHYIVPLDADDIWYPDAVSKCVSRIEQYGEKAGLVYGWSANIDENSELLGTYKAATIEGEVLSTLLCHNFLGNGSATLIRKSAIADRGMYDPNFPATGCEDWEFYLRIAAKYHFCAVPEFMIGYRKHTQSMSTGIDRMMESHEYVLNRARIDYPNVPHWCHAVSRSGLLLYLAQESHRHGRFRESSQSVRKAAKSGHVFTLIRPAFYLTLLKNLLRISEQGARPAGSSTLKSMAASPRLRFTVFLQQVAHRMNSLLVAQRN